MRRYRIAARRRHSAAPMRRRAIAAHQSNAAAGNRRHGVMRRPVGAVASLRAGRRRSSPSGGISVSARPGAVAAATAVAGLRRGIESAERRNGTRVQLRDRVTDDGASARADRGRWGASPARIIPPQRSGERLRRDRGLAKAAEQQKPGW
jgi:hypothetical protein